MASITSDSCASPFQMEWLKYPAPTLCAVASHQWTNVFAFSRNPQVQFNDNPKPNFHIFCYIVSFPLLVIESWTKEMHVNLIHYQTNFSGCSRVFAIEAATLHPAKCLGIEKSKGTLDFGADADFVFLDDDLTVRSTWIAGNQVYSK